MGKKLTGNDKTEQKIIDFMHSNYPKTGKLNYSEKWLKARDGNIISVFIEYLEVFRKQSFSSEKEEQMIDDYRCLSEKGRTLVAEYLFKIYSEERNEKS